VKRSALIRLLVENLESTEFSGCREARNRPKNAYFREMVGFSDGSGTFSAAPKWVRTPKTSEKAV